MLVDSHCHLDRIDLSALEKRTLDDQKRAQQQVIVPHIHVYVSY